MSVRLYSEFSSSEGNIYKIEIHDSSWGAAPSSEFRVDGSGFQLTYDGQTDDIISPIVSSKLTFGAYSENSSFETFINTLKTFQENRFRVAVYRKGSSITVADFEQRVKSDGGTLEARGCLLDAVDALGGPDGYSLYWAGWITQDLVQVEDVSQPYIFQITATDGLGKLANIDYNVANDIDQGGLRLTRITQLVINALKLAGLYDLWGSSDTFLETSADWWETTQHTYSTSTDPLYLTAVDAGLLQSYDSDNNLVYNNGLEALRQVATLFAGRIYLSEGRWILEQYAQRATVNRYVSRYTYGGAAISRTLVSDDIALDQTTYAARMSGNNWDFLPAMRKAQINYVQKFLNPYGFFGGWRYTNASPVFTGGFMAGGAGIQLGLGTAAFNFSFKGASTAAGLMPLMRATIAIQDANGVVYYYGRSFNGTTSPLMYTAEGWSTVPGFYYFDLKAVNYIANQNATISEVVQIITQDLPTSGLLAITIQLDSIRVMATNAQYNFTSANIDAPMLFNIINGGNQSNAGTIFSSVNNESGIDSQLTLDLGDVFFAEGPPQTGHLAVFNGTSWVGSNLWRKGSTGAGLRILKLLTSEALALHVRPIERYNGDLIGSYGFSPRLQFESKAYLRTGGNFSARMDQWDGEMYAIQRIRTSVQELDEVGVLDRVPLSATTTTSGTSPNDLDTGRVAGMVIDSSNQALGPFQKVATGGKVLGTLDVQDSLTVEEDLIVEGDTTIVGTIDVTDLEVSNDLTVSGSSTVGTLSAGATTLSSSSVTGNQTVGGTLGVTGASTLGTLTAGASSLASSSVTGNQTVGGTLGVTGASTLGTLSAGASTLNSATVTTTLGVTGATTLGTLSAGASTLSSAAVTGNHTVGGTLGVTGTSTLGTLSAGASTLASSSVTGNQTVGGTLGVTGTSTLGTLSAGASTLASSSVTGNQTVGGTLGVTGASTLGTLSAGASTLASSSVTGNQTVGGTLGVTGASTLGTLSAGASTLNSATVTTTLGVTGASTLGTLSAGASTLASSSVTGNQTIGGTLGVTGTTTLGTLSAGASTLSSAAVTGNQTVGGTLGVTGASTLGTLSAGASTLNSATVTTTLGVTGATTLGTLSAGASTLASSSVTGNQTVGGTLGVTGASTLGTLSAGASTLASSSVTGNQTVGGTLGVTGETTLSNVVANDVTAADVVLDNVVSKTAVIGTAALVESFRARVLADGGTFEAFDEVVEEVTLLLAGGANKSAVVYGETEMQTLSAQATSVTTLAASGSATVGGTLGVTGASTLGTLTAGASTLASSSVTGNQTIGGTLGVTGASTLGTLSAGASTLNSATVTTTLGVSGASTLGTLSAGASTLASSSVTGNQTVGGTLGVTGASTLGTLSAGASTLNSATVTTTLGVTGASTLGTLSAGASTLASSSVTGNQTVGGTLGVTGASTLGTLSAGASTLASSSVTGNQTVGGTLGVTGATTLGTLSAGASTLSSAAVTGNQTVGGALDVVGRTSTKYLQLDTTFEPNGEPAGTFYWDQDAGVAAVRGIDGVALDLNEKSIWYVKNQSGATITKGSAVYADGTLGSSGQVLIAKMIANGTINAKYFLGITQSDLDEGADGYVVSMGKIRQINTSGYTAGQVLYVSASTAGALTATEPQAPNLKLPVAFVVNAADNGTIAIRQTAGTYLAESHDVQIDSPVTNEVLARSSSGRWENTPVDALFTETDATPAETDQSSFSKIYGGAGTMLGEPDSWMPITINNVNYLIPLFLAP